MRVDSHGLVRAAFVLGAMTCFGMAMAAMYEAGCAGDLKSGSYGDLAEALRLEARAACFAEAGAIAAALVAGTLPRLGPMERFFQRRPLSESATFFSCSEVSISKL